MVPQEFVGLIRKSTQHRFLYHFTDSSNFESIAQHGLLSKAQMKEKGIWPPAHAGGNQLSWNLDEFRGIDDSVSLCMTRNHGMKFLAQKDGRLPDARYLAIDPDVLLIPGVRIALGVANSNDVEIFPVAEAIGKMDLEVIYSRTDWKDGAVYSRLRAAEKYEVLVPKSVDPALILGVV
ncbi:DarT ssDNA thymidine ADP-ribosyltransferase family protein [Xanthobacter flavus]|uniref:DarT ssDNA thymidine ADP-ribosyltransferase family protein n=1 Tax=Xanthobacter flavus TaxID=281 RepID=UPI00372C185C